MTAANGLRLTNTAYGVAVISTASNTSLNATNLAMAFAVQAESTEAITHVWFRGGARTGTPPTYSIRIELLDASGNPDNADAGGGSPTAKTFTPPADTTWNGVGQWIELTNSWTPTLGQRFAIVIRHSSGTCDGSNFFSFTSSIGLVNNNSRNFPCFTSFNGSSWAKSTAGWTAAWKGSSGVYGYPTTGAVSNAASATSGRRVAAVVTIPSTQCSSFTVASIEAIMDIGSASGTIVFGIWNAAGTAITSMTIDTDEMASINARSTRIQFESQPTLTAGVEYYFGLESTGGGSPSFTNLQLGSSGDRAAFPNGANMAVATWDGSAWTKDETVFPLIEITAADITLPSGSGGGALILGGLGQTGIGAF